MISIDLRHALKNSLGEHSGAELIRILDGLTTPIPAPPAQPVSPVVAPVPTPDSTPAPAPKAKTPEVKPAS